MIPDKKVFLITGASSGIGKEIATLLSKENCSLALLARRGDLLNSLAEQLKPNKAIIKTYVCDVSNIDNVQTVIGNVRANFGQIDVAILNAGVGYKSVVPNYESEKAKETFDVNVFGITNFVEFILPDFIKRKQGMIVGISSLADSRGWKGSGFYCASKAAATILLENLRVELKLFNIKVITVKPGFVETPMTAKNKLPMPFLMSAEKAAKIIINGMKKEKKVIQFPLPLVISSKLMRIVPDFLFEYFAKKQSLSNSD